MLRYYQPGLKISQWPGITRDSQFVYEKNQFHLSWDQMKKINSFLLLTTDEVPPGLPGFTPVDISKILDCREGFLKRQDSWLDLNPGQCSPVHTWYLITYEPMTAETSGSLDVASSYKYSKINRAPVAGVYEF